jgi:hypothetical protein
MPNLFPRSARPRHPKNKSCTRNDERVTWNVCKHVTVSAAGQALSIVMSRVQDCDFVSALRQADAAGNHSTRGFIFGLCGKRGYAIRYW